MTANSTPGNKIEDTVDQEGELPPKGEMPQLTIGRRLRTIYLFTLFALLLLGGITFILGIIP